MTTGKRKRLDNDFDSETESVCSNFQVVSPLGDSVSSRRFSPKANYLTATSWDKVCCEGKMSSVDLPRKIYNPKWPFWKDNLLLKELYKAQQSTVTHAIQGFEGTGGSELAIVGGSNQAIASSSTSVCHNLFFTPESKSGRDFVGMAGHVMAYIDKFHREEQLSDEQARIAKVVMCQDFYLAGFISSKTENLKLQFIKDVISYRGCLSSTQII